MRIAWDLDDILKSTIPRIMDWHNDTYGTTFTRADLRTFDLTVPWQCTKEEATARLEQFWLSGYDDSKPYAAAQEVIAQLRDHEHLVVTSRSDKTDAHTRAFLREGFGDAFKDVLYATHLNLGYEYGRTKAQLCKAHKVEMLIDDCLEYVNQCPAAGIKALLLDSPWNQGRVEPGAVRIYTHGDVLAHVR